MKILICGDSYCATDPAFPNVHWSEKISNCSTDYEVCNLAYGGCSNALIVLQMLQGLALEPDFVVLSFTNEGRYEVDKDITALPLDLSSDELSNYMQSRYSTNLHKSTDSTKLEIIKRYMTLASSRNLEKLKNYFYISFCLQTLHAAGIKFCYSLGGFKYRQDYELLVKSNFVKNFIADYSEQELLMNLWDYGNAATPFFHVADESVHEMFANECIERMK